MGRGTPVRWGICLLFGVLVLHLPQGMRHGEAQNRDAELDLLRQQVEELRRQEIERQGQIKALQRKIEQLHIQPAPGKPAEPPASALDKAIQELKSSSDPTQSPRRQPATQPALLSQRVGRANFRLIDISADLLVALGGSSEN